MSARALHTHTHSSTCLYRRENWNWLRNWHSIALRKWFSFTQFFLLLVRSFIRSFLWLPHSLSLSPSLSHAHACAIFLFFHLRFFVFLLNVAILCVCSHWQRKIHTNTHTESYLIAFQVILIHFDQIYWTFSYFPNAQFQSLQNLKLRYGNTNSMWSDSQSSLHKNDSIGQCN